MKCGSVKMAHFSRADVIFVGGDIVTLNDGTASSPPEALAVAGNRIIALGRREDVLKLRDTGTEVVDLNGRALLPGFIASHTHPFLTTSLRYFTDITTRTHSSPEAVLATMKKTVGNAVAPNQWAVFYGYDECLLPDLPKLDADFLDLHVSSRVPVLVISVDVDNAWFNRKALEIAGVGAGRIPSLGEGRAFVTAPDGHPTGQLRNPAMCYIMSVIKLTLTDEDKRDLYREHFREYSRSGFTTVVDLGSNDMDTVRVGLEVAAEDDCPIRLARYVVSSLADPRAPPPKPDPDTNRVWVAGVKFWADGDPQSAQMALNEEYLDTDLIGRLNFPAHHSGRLNYATVALRRLMEPFHENGWQIATHANGDRCVDQVLEVYGSLLSAHPRADHRHRLEHAVLVTPSQLGAAAEMGVTPSFLVDIIYYYGKSLERDLVGPERASRLAPLSCAAALGHRYTIHEDSPLFPIAPEPFRSIATAASRRTRPQDGGEVLGSEYCVSVEDALKACTVNAAWQVFCERSLGSLEVGKLADMVVLSHNPLKVSCDDLESVTVIATYMNGRAYKHNDL